MFVTLRRHRNWVLVLIVAFMIIPLLYWTDQTSGSGRGGGAADRVTEINGRIVTPRMLGEVQREVRLLYFLNFRKWPEEDHERAQQIGFDLENEAWLRLFRVGKAEEAGIHVSDKAVAELAHRLLGDYPVDRFEKEVLLPNALNADDFERFVMHDAAIQQLSSVVGAAGRMITPAEAEQLYRRENQELSGDIVFFSLSNYLSKVVITNGALTNFFGQQMSRYRVPDKMRVSYVEFAKTNFLADADKEIGNVTNLQARLLEIYYKAGTNSFKDTNGNVLSETAALEKIKDEQRDRLALNFAARRANEFANKIYDKQPLRAENLELAASEEKLPVHVTMPFDIREGPTNLDVAPRFAQVAFSLDPINRPISFEPIAGEKGIYLIALKDTIPGRAQSYEEVRDKVTDDYKHFNAYTLARNDGTNLVGIATNGLVQGKTFEESAQKLGLKVETLPPISQSTDSLTNLEARLNVRQLKSIVFSLEPNTVSSYIPNPPDGGFVVYVRAKLPFDETKLRQALPKFTAELRYQKQNEIFGQWFRKEVEKANLPLNKPKQPGGPI
ncbi:MAG TPA: peptidylprolyl isomerase [Methylomirabilota bacterium]|nr:peptidylprolyl isomerase [Methylomirabilota bacterium]